MTHQIPELKSCPFCGGRAYTNTFMSQPCQLHGDRETIWRVQCKHQDAKWKDNSNLPYCHAKPVITGGSKLDAIEKWNTRADLTEPVISELREILGIKNKPDESVVEHVKEIIRINQKMFAEWQKKFFEEVDAKNLEDAANREACESCEGTGRSECLPDSEHTHPCDDCNGELLKEFQRGVAFAESLQEPVIDDGLLFHDLLLGEMGSDEYQNMDVGEQHKHVMHVIRTHALKTREKPVEVTIEWLVEMDYMEKYNAEQLFKACPNGIKIVDGGA